MLDFQRYQLAFTAHIRDPAAHPKPKKISDTRLAIYREIVFNNLLNTVSGCFPVCQSVLGKRKWRQLCRAFFATHQSTTPFFREIPGEFVCFINTNYAAVAHILPIYIKELVHYEWIELKLNTQEAALPVNLSLQADFLHETPLITPAHALLQYDYPVHLISKKYLPEQAVKTHLLVYRTPDFKIQFVELNPITFSLLCKLENTRHSGKAVLELVAAEINHPDTQAVVAFGLQTLEDLASQDAIVGSVNAN